MKKATLRSLFLGALLAMVVPLGCGKRGSKADAWLSPHVGPLSVQDVNADGYDDCVVWMGMPTPTSLQVIDGKSGQHRHSLLSADGESAVVSGNHLIYTTYSVSRRALTNERIAGPPKLALVDLRSGALVASETLPHGHLELFSLGKGGQDVLAHTSSGDLYVSVEQGKIFPSGALYETKAKLIGARRPPREDYALEQALERLGWSPQVAEGGAKRAVQNQRFWVVPRDRNYAHLAMLERATLALSWEIDLGEGSIVALDVGDELACAVLRVDGQPDALVLVDLSARRMAFRYQRD